MIQKPRKCRGFTLTELMAAVAIIAVLATLVCSRVGDGQLESKIAGCNAHKGNIEIQCELWRRDTGAWPAADLADIGGDVSYFPEGLPACPVDGSVYTIDSTGRVVGHNH